MKPLAVVLVILCASCPLVAHARSDGLDVTVTDRFGFEIRVKPFRLMRQRPAGTDSKPAELNHLPLVSEGKRANLWLAQTDVVTFSAAKSGRVQVDAKLQGDAGDEVKGVLKAAGAYYFAGKIAAGERKGRKARFSLTDVQSFKNHTKYEGEISGEAGRIPPMPAPDEDVLWVSSVPLGAEVYAKPFDCKAAQVWKDYVRIGKTPLTRELGPGKYAVRVLVPARLAAKLRPSTKLGEDTNPFEHDGWGEVTFRKGENVISSVTYTVRKREGKAATLISLFQPKALPLKEVVERFPKGHNFRFAEKKLEGRLLYHEIPKEDVSLLIEALRRGGKVIWHGKKKSLMITLTTGPKGWNIGGATRPKKKR
jgi:hypothetical protein